MYVYNSLCRFVLRCRIHHCLMYESLSPWSPEGLTFKCIYFNFPSYLKQLLIPFTSQYSLRHMDHLFLVTPRISKYIGHNPFKYKAPSDWNNLPSSLRSITYYYFIIILAGGGWGWGASFGEHCWSAWECECVFVLVLMWLELCLVLTLYFVLLLLWGPSPKWDGTSQGAIHKIRNKINKEC